MSIALVKMFWLGLFLVLSLSFVFLGTVGIPFTQVSVVKAVPKEALPPQ